MSVIRALIVLSETPKLPPPLNHTKPTQNCFRQHSRKMSNHCRLCGPAGMSDGAMAAAKKRCYSSSIMRYWHAVPHANTVNKDSARRVTEKIGMMCEMQGANWDDTNC